MAMDSNRKIAAILVKGRLPKAVDPMDPAPMLPDSMKGEEGEIDDRLIAAHDVMSAFKDGDAKLLKEALCNFIDLHQEMDQEAEMDES